MKNEDIINKLKSPFKFEDIEWKVKILNSEKTQGIAWAYINSRAIQDRLDEVLGSFNWKNEFMLWQDKSQICGISLFDKERNIWITKYDGAGNTDNEPIKGGLSSAFKRAAVQWGIGRYLYEFPNEIWVDVEMQGKSARIKRGEYKKLEEYYNKCIKAITDDMEIPDIENGSNQNSKAVKCKKDSIYKITDAVENEKSICVKILNDEGKEITAYARKESKGLKSGAFLSSLNLEKRTSDFGTYYTVLDYEVAA